MLRNAGLIQRSQLGLGGRSIGYENHEGLRRSSAGETNRELNAWRAHPGRRAIHCSRSRGKSIDGPAGNPDGREHSPLAHGSRRFGQSAEFASGALPAAPGSKTVGSIRDEDAELVRTQLWAHPASACPGKIACATTSVSHRVANLPIKRQRRPHVTR